MTIACINSKTGRFIEPTEATLAKATPTQREAIDGVREAMKQMESADADVKATHARVIECASEFNAVQAWERKHPSGMTRIQAARDWIASTR